MMTDQLLSDGAGCQGRHSTSDAPVSSPVAARLHWTWVLAARPIDPRLASRRRHSPPGTPAGDATARQALRPALLAVGW